MTNFFLLAIKLVRKGFCPVCYGKYGLSRSGISSYYCPSCECTSTIEKDYIIMEWYTIKHGRRILKSRILRADNERWKEMVDYLKEKHRKS